MNEPRDKVEYVYMSAYCIYYMWNRFLYGACLLIDPLDII